MSVASISSKQCDFQVNDLYNKLFTFMRRHEKRIYKTVQQISRP